MIQIKGYTSLEENFSNHLHKTKGLNYVRHKSPINLELILYYQRQCIHYATLL
jgi:hypothetical protein